MALMSLEDHRLLRIKAGHGDMSFKKEDGKEWVGLYQNEWDDFVAFRKAWPSLLDEVEALRTKSEKWEDLVERARHLAACVFKGETKADHERARHNAAVLANGAGVVIQR